MSKDCSKGRIYDCPYMKECISRESIYFVKAETGIDTKVDYGDLVWAIEYVKKNAQEVHCWQCEKDSLTKGLMLCVPKTEQGR